MGSSGRLPFHVVEPVGSVSQAWGVGLAARNLCAALRQGKVDIVSATVQDLEDEVSLDIEYR